MRSLTYELTTIYADQLKSQKDQKVAHPVVTPALPDSVNNRSLNQSCLDRHKLRAYMKGGMQREKDKVTQLAINPDLYYERKHIAGIGKV
jgi:hypothetical protein